jgi:HEAT repeat protein
MGLIKSTPAGAIQPTPTQRHEERTFAQLSEELLNDALPDHRRRAALELEAFPEAVELLCARVASEPDDAVVEAIFTTLIRQRGHEVVQGLVPYLRSEDAALRNQAVAALQSMPDDVGPYMELLVEDVDPDVRIFAINILGNLHHPLAHVWLQQVIEQDENPNVCATAVDVLAEVGEEAQVPALEALPGRFDNEPFFRFVVDTAVRRIRGDGK